MRSFIETQTSAVPCSSVSVRATLIGQWAKRLYVLWAVLTFTLVFAKNRLSADNVTHLGIIVFFFVTLWIGRLEKNRHIANAKLFFIVRYVCYAAVVEGFYMITEPVLHSLRITSGMAINRMVKNYAIDLSFTLPAYVLIAYVVWRLASKYDYGPWDYSILVAIGQALGDGNRAFLAKPTLLVFLPYVMINYHAMNLAPFLAIEKNLPKTRDRGPWKWVAPIVVVVGVYLICGLAIYSTAGALKMR